MYRSVSPKSTDNRSMHGGIVIGLSDSRLIGEGNVIELCSWERHLCTNTTLASAFSRQEIQGRYTPKNNFDGCVTIAS